jgi:salicylate hydroxylase
MMGSAKGSLEYAYRLATTLEGPCYTVEYRLAPEHPYPAALDDAVDAYRGLLATGASAESIILSGESSGAALALAVGLAVRKAGDPLPGGILAIAPFADLTLSGESLKKENGNDPAAHRDLLTFMGASYFQGHEPTDPLVSPVYADLAGLPPIFLAATRGEVLFSDATRLAENAERVGVDVTTEFVDDSVHVFTIFPFLPETHRTMEAIRNWSQKQGGTSKRNAA